MNKLSTQNSNNNFELISPNQYINRQLFPNSNSNIDYRSLYQNLISNLYSNINPILPNSNQKPPSKNSLLRLDNLQDQMVLNDQAQAPFTVVFQPANTGVPTLMLPPPPPPAATVSHPQPPPFPAAITPPSLSPPFTISLLPPTPISIPLPIFTTLTSTTSIHGDSSTLSTITHNRSSTETSNRISTNSGSSTKTSSSNTLRNTTASQATHDTKFKLSMGLITFILIQFVI